MVGTLDNNTDIRKQGNEKKGGDGGIKQRHLQIDAFMKIQAKATKR